jgi:hypothetical protein
LSATNASALPRAATVVFLAALIGVATSAGEERKGPLSALPSAPGAHLEKIKALGDNQWLTLGAPAADPKWGQACGRSWGARMCYAPEFKAAFLYGEGVHSFAKPDGRYMDDLWAYDLNAHRWVCVYPGGDLKNLTLKVDASGFEADADGQPIPVGQMTHGYEQMAYDSDRGRFMFMPCPSVNTTCRWAERRKTWGGGVTRPVNCSPWMYSAAAGRFELLKTQGPFPGSNFGEIMEYVPGIKKAVFLRGERRDVWTYEPAANTWSKLTPKGPPPPFGMDASACLDTKRDRIYLGGGYLPTAPGNNALWCYDVKADSWTDLGPKGRPCAGSNRYGPNQAMMKYDSVNDVVVLFYHRPDPGPGGRGVYVYDPAANAWGEAPLGLPKEVGACPSGFYSPDLNAHFIHAAGDSEDNGAMWVYRYRRAVGK